MFPFFNEKEREFKEEGMSFERTHASLKGKLPFTM
jgi:hypothetical protein